MNQRFLGRVMRAAMPAIALAIQDAMDNRKTRARVSVSHSAG
jgi:hypothetical protein